MILPPESQIASLTVEEYLQYCEKNVSSCKTGKGKKEHGTGND